MRGESGVAAYSLVAAVLMLIGAGAWVVATAPRVVASTQINPLEMMANVKDLPYFAGGGTKWSRDGRSTACSGRRCRRPCSIGAKIRHGYSASLRH